MNRAFSVIVVAGLATASSAMAQSGMNIPAAATTAGAPLLATQANSSNYGSTPSGGQASNGASRLDSAYGTISGGKLRLLLAGSLQANFNKMWVFFDTGAAGQSTLRNDNNDGGFNEINNLQGMTFDTGFTPSTGLRLEAGGGFVGVNRFSLPASAGGTGGSVWNTSGIANLPVANIPGNFGVNLGWDNQATGASAVPGSVTSGWNFEIDLAGFFGDAALSTIRVQTFITNGGGDNLSNQVLSSGNTNYPSPNGFQWSSVDGSQFFSVVPAPGAVALLGLGGLVAARRRRN